MLLKNKMDKRKQLEKIKKEIDKNYNKYLKKLYTEQSKIKDEIENEDCKELIGKTFIYKNNSYSCPEKKSDYWDVYLKVVDAPDGGFMCLTCEKDSYGCIQIQTQKRFGSDSLIGYVPCKEKEFENYYNKLLKEIIFLKGVLYIGGKLNERNN